MKKTLHILLVIWAFGFVTHAFWKNSNQVLTLLEFPLQTWSAVSFILLFSVLNWSADTKLWMSISGESTFKKALFNNIIAQSMGFATPFNAGEYYKRAKENQNKKAAIKNTFNFRWMKTLSRILGAGIILLFFTQINFRLIGVFSILISATIIILIHHTLAENKGVNGFVKNLMWGLIKFLIQCVQLGVFVFLFIDDYSLYIPHIPIFYALSGFFPSGGWLDGIIKPFLGTLMTFILEQKFLFSTGIFLVWFINVALPSISLVFNSKPNLNLPNSVHESER